MTRPDALLTSTCMPCGRNAATAWLIGYICHIQRGGQHRPGRPMQAMRGFAGLDPHAPPCGWRCSWANCWRGRSASCCRERPMLTNCWCSRSCALQRPRSQLWKLVGAQLHRHRHRTPTVLAARTEGQCGTARPPLRAGDVVEGNARNTPHQAASGQLPQATAGAFGVCADFAAANAARPGSLARQSVEAESALARVPLH